MPNVIFRITKWLKTSLLNSSNFSETGCLAFLIWFLTAMKLQLSAVSFYNVIKPLVQSKGMHYPFTLIRFTILVPFYAFE